ncbi:uncharacterized protein LOC118424282 [Branchiostoma floridae]|uniref:Uncharacterized protein LOC118424282 n=1 Tax=Branchiostoma floridae TaxID=7739 RepID=A0A9J7LUI1_BRAFL|nr:uncharacterized protein LOC118424282 [Branchiostoma floridae]
MAGREGRSHVQNLRLPLRLSWTTWLLFLFLTGFSFVSNAQDDTGWDPAGYPDPIRAPELCGRHNWSASFVCDPDGILTTDEANSLDVELMTTVTDTPCPCEECPGKNDGYNIAVALMKRMSDPGGSTPRVRAQGFAMYLRSVAWDYGRCNEGVVILVSTEDRQIYTATGATAREKLTDDIVDDIYGDTREYFTAGMWAEGLKEMATRYKKVFAGGSSSTTAAVVGTVFGVVGICGIGVFCIICKNGCHCRGGGSSSFHEHWNRTNYWSSSGGGDYGGGGGGGGGDGGGGGGVIGGDYQK